MELNKHRVECCSNNGVTHSSQPCFSLCLSSLLHSLSKLCSLLFFWVTFDLENYDSFIHFVLWQCFYDFFFSFCFVTMWNLENIFFVYTWIWFDIWCLLLIKAIFFLNFVYESHGVEWEAMSKEEEEIVNSSPLSYLLFGVFTFLLISIFVLYWNIKCLFLFFLLLWIAYIAINFVTDNNSNFCIFMVSYVWRNADEKG